MSSSGRRFTKQQLNPSASVIMDSRLDGKKTAPPMMETQQGRRTPG